MTDAASDGGGTDAASDGGGTDAGPDGGGFGGGCTGVCDVPHGSADCSAGSCVLQCENGYADCNATPDDGCEVSVSDNAAHCGACGRPCANVHGAVSCAGGLCVPSCAPGYSDCDANAANGCETDLQQTESCGMCGGECVNSHGAAACSAGMCVATCDVGYADCDGMPENGCEVLTASDVRHCGACNRACDTSSQSCVSGVCELNPCVAGRGECDSDTSDLCETDLNSSPAHCGFCGNACTAANGVADCTGAACTLSGCNAGYADCDLAPANGCEVSLTDSTDHCGACGAPCSNGHGTTRCMASSCVPSCNSGYGNCDGNPVNGCETALDTTSNCGSCGMSCTAATGGTAACNSGICTTICPFDGAYALKLTIASNWAAKTYVVAGNGTFSFWAKLDLTRSGNSLSGTVTPCGDVAPDFSANIPFMGTEKYGVIFPNTLFDRTPELPSTSVTATMTSQSPGATLSFNRAAWLVGASMSDPVNGAWPSRTALTQVDADADGKIAVTGDYKTSSGYTAVPCDDTLPIPRAARAYVATRVLFTLNGTLSSCTQSSGTATVPDVDAHTLGCRRSGSTSDCTNAQGAYLDDAAPNWQVRSDVPPSYGLVRLGSSATCANVRAALP